MKLYYFPGACSLATHITLEWIGAAYETVKLDAAGTKSREFLELNPNGAVPLLVDDDFVLSQNVAILFYLAERYPNAKLLGDGTPRGRADVMKWLSLLNSDIHPAFKPFFKPGRFHPDASLANVLADTARTNLREHFERIDGRMQGREWVADQRSIADPYLFVMLRWTFKLHVDTKGLDNLASFFARMLADPGVRAAITAEEGSVDTNARLGA